MFWIVHYVMLNQKHGEQGAKGGTDWARRHDQLAGVPSDYMGGRTLPRESYGLTPRPV